MTKVFEDFMLTMARFQIKIEKGRLIEVGSGAVTFTQVFLKTTKVLLHSIDLSNAVAAILKNNALNYQQLFLPQASIYEIPFENNIFDKVFC